MDLFTLKMENDLKLNAPLAERMRPRKMEDFFGQKHLVGENKYLSRLIKSDRISSMIFYGPPGIGKTSLAKIIANSTKKNFIQISAVTSNIKELREVLNKAENTLKYEGNNSILFIDEIHRFNKTQQDALLPFVERGIIILIGATTENPYFEVNKALISRCQILTLNPISETEIKALLKLAIVDPRGYGNFKIDISQVAIEFLAINCSGDARNALNSLELAILSAKNIDGFIRVSLEDVKDCIQKRSFVYDKNGEEHYNLISAFIKSIRGSDPDAAVFYLAKMLEVGEDPKFIARRLIILASEDVSNADPMALCIASATFEAVNFVGMPECRINLAQAVTYLASAPKSNSSYLAINRAIKDVKERNTFSVPAHLRDISSINSTSKNAYKYPHNYRNNYVDQQYLPDEYKDKKYYIPSENGYEKKIKEFLGNKNKI